MASRTLLEELAALLFLGLAATSLAAYIGILDRDTRAITVSTSFNGTYVLLTALRGSDAGLVLQPCRPSQLRVYNHRGELILGNNVDIGYWETVLHIRSPGIYIIVARGCGALRLIQPSASNPHPVLLLNKLDPYEEELLKRLEAVALASIAGLLAILLSNAIRRRRSIERCNP